MGGVATSASDAVGGRWGVRMHQTQEMKGKEGTGDPGGLDTKSGHSSSGSGLCPLGENGFFADDVGSSGGGGSSSTVVTGAVGGTPAHPARTVPSGAGVSSRTPGTPFQPTRGRGWSGWSGACRRSASPGGSGWSGGGGRMPSHSGGAGVRPGAGAGGIATT